jgi:hypothetical protein
MKDTREIKNRPRRGDRTARALGVAAIDRVADRIDLAIDLLTLGQYGLECREVPAGTNGCEGSKRRTRKESRSAWEAPRTSRRPGCEWQWPQRPASSGRSRA